MDGAGPSEAAPMNAAAILQTLSSSSDPELTARALSSLAATIKQSTSSTLDADAFLAGMLQNTLPVVDVRSPGVGTHGNEAASIDP